MKRKLLLMIVVFISTFISCEENEPLPVAVTDVTLNVSSLDLTEGDEYLLAATVNPENAANKAVAWASSDEAVAMIKDGKVTAVKAGTATITVTTEDGGKTATCEVMVNAKVYPVESVSLDKAYIELVEDDDVTLSAKVYPENATNKNIVWSSNNETVAKVDNGLVTAINEGSATITVTTEDGNLTASCEVVVSNNPFNDPIAFADAEMKGLCVIAFDTNSDADISYKEAAAVEDISKMELSTKTFSSFDEFQYFTSVKEIPDNYFANIETLRSIVLPDGLKVVGASAFSGCSGLVNITISESVTAIGNYAFGGCTSLQYVNLPDNVEKLGDTAFGGCINLTEVKLSSSITHIGQFTFNNCINLQCVILPEGLQSIGGCAFYYCNNLTNIVLPKTLKTIGSDEELGGAVFQNCISLKSITIPESVTYLCGGAFSSCSGLSEVIVLGQIETIEYATFSGCKNLTYISLPNSLIEIEYGAFANCENLSQVEIASVESWCQVSFLTPDNVGFYSPDSNHPMCYGADLYVNGEKIINLVIPEGVTTITDNAFKNCTSIKTLTIPEDITYIGAGAFANCNYLREVYCKPITPPVLEDYSAITSYSSIDYQLTNFYVPYTSLELYKSAEVWSGYYNKGTEFFPNPNFFGYDFEAGTIVE